MATDREETRDIRPRRGDRGLFGMVLLFAGVIWFLSRAGMLHVAADTLLSILLMCIGAGLLITRRSGRKAWPILLGGVVLFVLMGSSASARIQWGGPDGHPDYAPTSVSDLRPYQLVAGDMHLDLSKLALTGTTPVTAKVVFGDLQVTVPEGVDLQIQYKDVLGDVSIDGKGLGDGFVSNQTWTSPGYSKASPKLTLDLEVVAGDITVDSVAPTRSSGHRSTPAANSATSGPSAGSPS